MSEPARQSATLRDLQHFLQWDDIRYFLAVARAGSLNSAARGLGVNQTTVGRRIKALEARLGADLFDRRDNRMMITSEGRAALEDAQRMDEIAEAFIRKLDGSNSRLAGEVRLNMTEGLAVYWLLPRLEPFQEAHPELKINWFVSDEISELGREADMAIRWQKPTEPQAVARRLGMVGYSIFANAAYVERHGMPKSLEDLAGHHFLQFNGYEKNPGLGRWNKLMRQIKPAMRLDNSASTQAAMRSGSVMALLPDYAPLINERAMRVPIDLGIWLDLWLVYHEDRRKNARIRALADEIYRLFEKDRGIWFI
jgi:DNA-binding transcriptional LysR family regulator